MESALAAPRYVLGPSGCRNHTAYEGPEREAEDKRTSGKMMRPPPGVSLFARFGIPLTGPDSRSDFKGGKGQDLFTMSIFHTNNIYY